MAIKGKIKDPIYGSVIHFYSGGAFSGARDWFKKLTNIDAEGELDDTDEGAIYGMHKTYIVYFKKRPSISTLAHEALHLTHSVLQDSGLRLSNESEEAYAYFLGWLTSELSKRVGRYGAD